MRDNALAQSIALAAQLGFAVACPMLAFIAGGAWLDGQLNTQPLLLLLGVLLGMLSAGGALYRLSTVQARKRKAGGGTQTPKAPYKIENRDEQKPGTNRANRYRRNHRRR